MPTGYVALLDVLRFRALISGDRSRERIDEYLACLKNRMDLSEVQYIVFSDSLVLSMTEDKPASFLLLVAECSRLIAELLSYDIPIRGTITYGQFVRTQVRESIFLAGRAVVDAYEFEQAQDWVGVMIAPNAVRKIEHLREHCELLEHWCRDGRLSEGYNDGRFAAFIQPCHSIPFRASTPLDESRFDGFAVVPTSGTFDPIALRDSTNSALERLAWLRQIAPSPSAQRKYSASISWLTPIQDKWDRIVRSTQRTT